MKRFSWKNMTIFMLAVSLLRLLLTMNLPILAVTYSGVDDYWMVMRANTILAGKWMGGYYNATLIKGMSFPTFLAVLHAAGISYYTGVTLFYLLSLAVLTVALKPFIDRFEGRRVWIVYAVFALLAFHPILYTAAAATRVYRNSITPSQVLLIIACLYALYLRRREPARKLVFWVVLLSLSMIFFIHTREDSMWIWVLYAVIAAITLGSLILRKSGASVRRILLIAVCLVIPAVSVFGMTTVIRTINKRLYGLPIVNELTEGHFATALQSLYEIRMEEEETDLVTVPYAKLEKAFEVSPALASIRDRLDYYYGNAMALTDPEAPGEYIDGLFFWQLRFAASDAGYHETLPKADAFYAQVTEEIQRAFDDGRLERRKGLMFSSLMPPFKKNTVKNSFRMFGEALKFAVTGDFGAAVLWTEPDAYQLAEFERMTYDRVVNGAEVEGDSPAAVSKLASYQVIVNRVNLVSKVYNVLKWPALVLGVLSYLALTTLCLVHHFRKDALAGGPGYSLWLFSTGFLGAFLIQVFIVGYNAAVNVGPANISTFYLTGCYPCWYLFALLAAAGALTGVPALRKEQ